MGETRTLRERQAAVRAALDSAEGDRAPYGSAALVAKTTEESTYPTDAAAFYAMLSQDLDGTEEEGATATFVSSGGPIFHAWNAGGTVPPSGTAVLCHAVGGRFVFRYDS